MSPSLTLFLARLAGCLAWSAAAPPPWPGYVVRSDTVAADGSHAVVYAPVPATQPDGPRPLKLMRAAATGKRGYGIGVIGGPARSWSDLDVRGFDQNVTVENVPGATLDNVTSLQAYRDGPALIYHGQPYYFGNAGRVSLTNFYGGLSGGCYSNRLADRTQYHHAVYSNFGTVLVARVGVVGPADNSGIQARDGGEVYDVVAVGCGIGVLATQGDLKIRNLTVYDCRYYADLDDKGRVKAWTGMSGLAIYSATVDADDVWIVGRKGQELGDPAVAADVAARKVKRYFGPAVSLNPYRPDKSHPEYKPRPKGKPALVAHNSRIAGWPGGPANAFGGADIKGYDRAGWTVTPDPIDYDPSPVLADLQANRISKAEAVATLTREIRGRVK